MLQKVGRSRRAQGAAPTRAVRRYGLSVDPLLMMMTSVSANDGYAFRERVRRDLGQPRWYQIFTLPEHHESGLQFCCCRRVTAAHNSGEGSPPVMSDRDAAALRLTPRDPLVISSFVCVLPASKREQEAGVGHPAFHVLSMFRGTRDASPRARLSLASLDVCRAFTSRLAFDESFRPIRRV